MEFFFNAHCTELVNHKCALSFTPTPPSSIVSSYHHCFTRNLQVYPYTPSYFPAGSLSSSIHYNSKQSVHPRQTFLKPQKTKKTPTSGFFLKITNPSKTLVKLKYSSVANSALSVYASKTGVLCVWNPVIVFGRPACPTTSTACPTRTVTGRFLRFSSKVMRKRG